MQPDVLDESFLVEGEVSFIEEDVHSNPTAPPTIGAASVPFGGALPDRRSGGGVRAANSGFNHPSPDSSPISIVPDSPPPSYGSKIAPLGVHSTGGAGGPSLSEPPSTGPSQAKSSAPPYAGTTTSSALPPPTPSPAPTVPATTVTPTPTVLPTTIPVGIGMALNNATQPEPPKEREIEKIWKIIKAENADFQNWTKLLSCADNEESIEEIRKAYEAFLTEFPLCYVYWKKYADHELLKGTEKRAMEIYDRALTKAIPHSVDLWSHYCGFVAEKSDNLDEIRSLFERALDIVGTDFAAHPLWNKYLGFENSQEEYKRIGTIFLRILHIPLEQTSTYWERFKSFVNSRPIDDIATHDELSQMTFDGATTLDKQRQWIINAKEKIHKKTLDEANLRRTFEGEALKINYFHVRPLDDSQLNNWSKYLEFEEEQGNHQRIVKLYERCIIPCCYYTKFWLKYIKYIEKHGKNNSIQTKQADYDARDAKLIFERACEVFLKKRPDIHLEYAIFEEQYKRYDSARAIYQKLRRIAPDHLETTFRQIGLERRLQNYTACEALFQEAISKVSSTTSTTSTSSTSSTYYPTTTSDENLLIFLHIEYAKFCTRAYGSNLSKAREVFRTLIEKFGKNKEVWVAFIHFEKNHRSADLEERVSAIFNEAVHSHKGLSEVDRLALLLEWIEFCTDEGKDIVKVRELSREYTQASLDYEASLIYGQPKRTLEDTTNSAEPPSKVIRTGDYAFNSSTSNQSSGTAANVPPTTAGAAPAAPAATPSSQTSVSRESIQGVSSQTHPPQEVSHSHPPTETPSPSPSITQPSTQTPAGQSAIISQPSAVQSQSQPQPQDYSMYPYYGYEYLYPYQGYGPTYT